MVLTEARAQAHPYSGRVRAVRLHPEQADHALLLPEHRPADEEDVVHPLQLDRAVDRQVRARAPRQIAVESDVDRHRPVLHRRVDAGDVNPG